MDRETQYWANQSQSLHRRADAASYVKKAEEHAAWMRAEDRTARLIDLGCGAGELLHPFSRLVRVTAGLDRSSSMLSACRARLEGQEIELIEGDIFTHLPESTYEVWTTTAGLNQYLGPDELHRLLDLFATHRTARSFYLFDCVDPMRWSLTPHGISYDADRFTAPRTLRGRLASIVLRVSAAGLLLLGPPRSDCRRFRNAGMGWGYLPRFWLKACAARSLEIEIISSRSYEYRYHIAIHRRAGDHG